MITIPLLLTYDHDCSYLDGARARSLIVDPLYPMTPALYAELITQGFRRSGNEVYKPHCRQCAACIPVRLKVEAFTPSRAQRRCLKRNLATQVVVKPPVFEQAHYDMYLRYQALRHEGGNMAQLHPDQYLDFLASTWCDTVFVEFSIADELAGVSVVDRLDNAWSAVYTFFDPKFSRYSPGVYALLWQQQQLKKRGLPFLYLGFWIADCKKMAYKNEYRPLQMLLNEQWVDVVDQPAALPHTFVANKSSMVE